VNAVYSGPPPSFFFTLAQLSAFGKKLVALRNKMHETLAVGMAHCKRNDTGFRLEPPPVSDIAFNIKRMRRH
jgi:hypothetical protein